MDFGLGAKALLGLSRATFLARRALARPSPSSGPQPAPPSATRRRNILFVTVDQQRYDALGVTGNRFARTPSLDALARSGVQYRRAHVQNVVCMPSRTTMLTGQHPLTHGVVANGISAGWAVASGSTSRSGSPARSCRVSTAPRASSTSCATIRTRHATCGTSGARCARIC